MKFGCETQPLLLDRMASENGCGADERDEIVSDCFGEWARLCVRWPMAAVL